MFRRVQASLLALVCAGMVSSCAVVESQVVADDADSTPDGMPYFMPRRPFIVTVSRANGLTTVSVAPGSAEPDLFKRFVLSQGTNWLADNEFNISVGANGLLKSSNSTATSEVATAVGNSANSAAFLTGVGSSALKSAYVHSIPAAAVQLRLAKDIVVPSKDETEAPKGPSIPCPGANGTYQYAVYPENVFADKYPLMFCADTDYSFIVKWRRADTKIGSFAKDNAHSSSSASSSGIFFRHEIPYVVTVLGGAPRSVSRTENDFIVTSPDESEIDYFPINRSFFANNTGNLTFTDGILTSVDQTTHSELATAIGLPATWLGNYTAALGQLLTGLTTVSGQQQKLVQQMEATAVAQNAAALLQMQSSAAARAQYQACIATVNSIDFNALPSGTTPAAAAGQIKSACPSS